MRGKISKLHEKLTNREITARSLTEKYLEYIKLYNPDLNAYITVCENEAIKSAEETDKKIAKGEKISLLSGIPMAVKDNICTDKILTTCASKMLYNFNPIYSAFAVSRLSEEGAVLLGKVNMDEFAMGSTGETSFFGAAKNPFDTRYVTGGSSSGSACAVASDMAVFSLGSDTGGSVRQPASFCGLIGLKPTYGAVSRYGLIAHASSLDQIGVITSSAEDASVVFDSISAYDKMDSTCASFDRKPTFDALKNDIKGVKIGVITKLFENLNSEIYAAIDAAMKSLEDLGAVLCPIEIENLELSLPAYYILACAEASSNLARYDGVRFGYRTNNFETIEEMIVKSRSEAFGAEVKRRILLGNFVLSSGYYDEYYKNAANIRKSLSNSFSEAFKKVDLLLCPTTCSTAFKLGEFENTDPVKMYLTDICTVGASIAGLPAISIPCGADSGNLPIGMQLTANKFEEGKLLNVAYRYEDENYKTMYTKPRIGGRCIEL